MKTLLASLFLLAFLSGCGQDKKQAESVNKSKETAGREQTKTTAVNNIDKFVGTFVSDGYEKRGEGFDWVGVVISKWSDSTAFIRVRSRTDKKKATCTYTSFAKLKDPGTLTGMYEGSGIIFRIDKDSLKVLSDNPADDSRPAYFCSGGGSLAGSYARITSGLDKTQMDSMSYSRALIMDKYIFDVLSTERDAGNSLTVRPVGDKNPENEFTLKYDGNISNAEIADLNADGYPEILFYVSSADKARKGTVYGFSSNKGKSLSATAFPQFADNPEASKGYRGFDEFAVVENRLVQRFPVFAEGSDVPTKTRQIQYIMKDGEAGRVFAIEKFYDF